MKKVVLGGLVLATIFAFSSAVAFAEFRGTDMWSNMTPGGGAGGLADRYPMSHYQLDYNVDFSPTHPSGAIPSLMQFTASWLFFFGAVIMRFVIYIFDWAFHANLLTGGEGLLSPLAEIVRTNYSQIILPFLVPVVICFGIWVAHKAISKKHKDVGSVIARTLLFFVVSFAVAFHPVETIGKIYSMVDGLSSAVVSRGGGAHTVSDSLFSTFIYRPWAVLQFGGMEVCVGSKLDSDGFPLATTDSTLSKTCHSVMKKDPDGHGNYAYEFIRYAPGKSERDLAYRSLRDGEPAKVNDSCPPDQSARGLCSPHHGSSFEQIFPGWKIDKTDAPAVDMMQADGALQRLAYAIILVFGMIGGILLIGLLSMASLFAQLAVALLFVASSFALLAAILPITHALVERWLKLLLMALVGKLVYALLLMAVLSISGGLLLLGGDQGYLIVFFLQALLYFGVFKKRKVIIEKLTSSKAAQHYSNSESQTKAFVAGAATGSLTAIESGASGFANSMRHGWSDQLHGESDSSQQPDGLPQASDENQAKPPESGSPQNGATQPVTATQNQNGDRPMPTRPFRDDLEQTRQTRAAPQQPPQDSASSQPEEDGLAIGQADLHESFYSAQKEPLEQIADTPHTSGEFANDESFADALRNARDREYYER